MSIDILSSRRSYFDQCQWWSRVLPNDNNSELVFQRQPSGSFFVKEQGPEIMTNNTSGGVMMYDNVSVTLKSPDNLENLKQNDLVMYKRRKWIVENVQKVHYRQKSSEFAESEDNPHMWYLRIRGL